MKIDNNAALLKILRKSHKQVLAGKTYSMDYVKQFMNDKLHELEHRMDCSRVAESL